MSTLILAGMASTVVVLSIVASIALALGETFTQSDR